MATEEKEKDGLAAADPANNANDNKAFDPTAFLGEDADADPNPNGGDNGNGDNNADPDKGSNADSDDDSDDVTFNFDDDDDDDSGAGDPPAGDPQAGDPPVDTNKKKIDDVVDNDFISELDKIGIKVKDKTEALAEIKKLQNEILEAKTKHVSNDRIDFYKKLLPLGDKELVEKDLKARGFSPEKLEKALKTFESNDTMDIEAEKIRMSIKDRITLEVEKEAKATADQSAKRSQAQVEARQQLKDHIDKTETMFGFKIVKDPALLPKAKEAMFKYIDSGKAMNDILKDPQSFYEAAYFMKHKEQILNAIRNKGSQTAKQNLLKDIGHHTVDDTTRIPGNDKDVEFNPQKFSDVS